MMGSATAYHLRRLRPSLNLAVIERDPSYRYSSTLLSDGNVRIQFNLPENILMSQFAMQVLETFPEDFEVDGWQPQPDPRRQGNLFLADADSEPAARVGMQRQLELGCQVEWLTAAEVAGRFPAYAGPGYVGGTLGRLDGSVDPSAVLHGYRRKAIALGATFLQAEVIALMSNGQRAAGVRLSDGSEIESQVVVNATGAWCAELAATVGVNLPVLPVMRSVYVVETPLRGDLPSVFLPSGLYLLPEAEGRFLVGWSQPDDPVSYDFKFARTKFEDRVWPELLKCLPAFEALRLVGGWAGLYEVNTLDGNAIVGEWPGLPGLWLANGFSGHGFQQCHAVGRHLAEMILELQPSLDLSRFGPQRIVDQIPYPEHPGRLI